MQVTSVVGLITNSSSVIYSYADINAFTELMKYIPGNWGILVYPDLETIAENTEMEELEDFVGVFFEYDVMKNWNTAPEMTEETEFMYEPHYYHKDQIVMKSLEDIVKESGLTKEDLLEIYPQYFQKYLAYKEPTDFWIDGISFTELSELADKLFDFEKENVYTYMRPSTSVAIYNLDTGEYDSKVVSICYRLFDHEATYDG